MTVVREELELISGDGINRRGMYLTRGMGISQGTGRRAPGMLSNTPREEELLRELLDTEIFHGMARFASDSLKHFFPATWAEYDNALNAVIENDPTLTRLYDDCCFAACHINFPPFSWTRFHLDSMNLARGLCAVWALGDYDPTQGGHLILWDLGYIIEFPPGNLILLPSALVIHGNLSIIQNNVIRAAFVLYSAGGLFRYVENGMRNGGATVKEYGREAFLKRNLSAFPIY
ncbi:hypothetical protein BDZ89DRAFT_956973 [Hymenopellis radicata]|nr:hypothetical protein BDZ89DRAFT_956973 [Hymenopellis radicata]